LNVLDALFVFTVYACTGLGLEVVFTAIFTGSARYDRARLFGHSSLWYVPLYGLALPWGVHVASPMLAEVPFIVRGMAYAVMIQTGEYVAMGILRKLNGVSPTEGEYRAAKLSVHGLTRLDYFPAFVLLGLFYEALHKTLCR
jgi:hypothetical protein